MAAITPIILAGGSGTRLWPISRKSYPKQFSEVIGNQTLFQQAAGRFMSSEHLEFNAQVTITNSEFRFIICKQLADIGIDPGPILIEPTAKNTAPAILAAALFENQRNPNAILLIAPSDHIIPDKIAFHEAIRIGLKAALEGDIVTFGVETTRPETGYGYLEVSKSSNDGVKQVNRFIEKPSHDVAKEMFKSDEYLWNAGIFLAKASTIIDAFRALQSTLFQAVENSIKAGRSDLGFFRLDEDTWDKCEDISIDYAIMEPSRNLVAVPFGAHWSDLGGWSSVWSEMEKDAKGVALSSNAHAFDCTNTLLRSESESQEIVGIGLKDIVAVSMKDAVLIADKGRSQDIKRVVAELIDKNISQGVNFPNDHRPWGWFETLADGKSFQVKRIVVKPGGALSLQSHKHRSEHWVNVEGIAKVTLGEDERFLEEGESIYIPLGAIHRLENPGTEPLILIEVQIGTYLGEDDIIRYEDVYNRL